MLARLLPRLMAACLFFWGLATAWAVTVTGVLEPATLDVDYYIMGAGNDLFLFRLGLTLAITLLAVVWAFVEGTPGMRLLRLFIAPCVLFLFTLSVGGLDRTSPGFSQEQFLQIVTDHLDGRKVTLSEVQRLGKPLIVARYGDRLVYSYTFTPSGGFGWHKRALTFDPHGNLIDFLNLDEP